MRLVSSLVLAFVTGCVGATRETRPVAYLVNGALVTAGVVAVGYAMSHATREPESVQEAVDQLSYGFVEDMLLVTAGLTAVVVGGVGIGLTLRAQSREEEAVSHALAAEARGRPAAEPEHVPAPAPEVERLVVQARLLASSGQCEAARAIDRRIRERDPVWHRVVFAGDAGMARCP